MLLDWLGVQFCHFSGSYAWKIMQFPTISCYFLPGFKRDLKLLLLGNIPPCGSLGHAC